MWLYIVMYSQLFWYFSTVDQDSYMFLQTSICLLLPGIMYI